VTFDFVYVCARIRRIGGKSINNGGKRPGPIKALLASLIDGFSREWIVLAYALFRPLVLLPLAVCVASLSVVNSSRSLDKNLSVVLQIIAAISSGCASALIVYRIREALGQDPLKKKGLSAVRNLLLTRSIVRKISGRTRDKAAIEEIVSSLDILEKNVGNAIQEWTDIIPGLEGVEAADALLSEREEELKVKRAENETLNEQLQATKEIAVKDKEKLQHRLKNNEEIFSKLTHEVAELRHTSRMGVGSASLLYGVNQLSSPDTVTFASVPTMGFVEAQRGLASVVLGACAACGKPFVTSRQLGGKHLPTKCPECSAKESAG
jgi:hypothetical protein